jgi:hypothetical protein
MNDEIIPKSTSKRKRAPWLWATLALIVVAGAGALYLMPEQAPEEQDSPDAQSLVDEASPDETTAEPEDTPTTTTTFTGSECESTLALYCAPLLTRDWMTWCNSQIEAWRAVGVDAINPCANSKYSKDSCTEAAILGGYDVPQACIDYSTALNTSSAGVQEACLYTTKPGGVCYGITPKPVTPGTAPEDVVVPLDDCLEENYETLTVACQDAFDFHQAVSKSTTR